MRVLKWIGIYFLAKIVFAIFQVGFLRCLVVISPDFAKTDLFQGIDVFIGLTTWVLAMVIATRYSRPKQTAEVIA
jgi:hypothetical protein